MADERAEEQKSLIEDEVRKLFRRGAYAEAVPFIQRHLASHADDVPAHELLADALRFTGDKPGAAGALATASELYAKAGMTVQSIAAQKRVLKLGVTPDFTATRLRETASASTVAAARMPTPLFDDLSDEEFQAVAERLDARFYAPGDVVVEEGTPGDALFVIASGRLQVVTSAGGREIDLAELGPGDFFGEVALLSHRPRTATIRAVTDAECLALSRTAFDELAERMPNMRKVMEDFTRRRAESTIEALVKKRTR